MNKNKSEKIEIDNINDMWRVHTSRLFNEILSNNSTYIFEQPLRLFAGILAEVAERASELNDEKLNKLMARLTLYEVTDPYSKEYDKEITNKLLKNGKI